ncbi:MAG: SulP family inorganic anion transporter, partial [Nitrospiraceae bacterium]
LSLFGETWKVPSVTKVLPPGSLKRKTMVVKTVKSPLMSDVFASFVVFLVALPLCMGIAVASGAPPAAGIITGIVGGLVVGALAGCPLQVSGPAAGLTVIIWQLIQTYGIETLGVIVMLAGAIQILAACLQLGQWFRAVSPAVIHGMLAGIGILIFASQFHVMIDDLPKGGGLDNLLTIPLAIWKAANPSETHNHHVAAGIGILTIAAIVLWEAFSPKQLRFIPAVLVGVALATVVSVLQDLPISHVQVRDDILAVVQFPGAEHLTHLFDTSIWAAALGMALIASVETLLSATAVDQLHSGPRTRYNRELVSQGTGNLLCGLLGVLPLTGVIVRSSSNVYAGARTRASAMLHGVWLLLFVAFLPFVLRLIPTSSLAAVLVYTGYKLMNVRMIQELKVYGRSEVLIYAGTLVSIVATNLLTGVLVGVGMAVAKLIYTTQNLDAQVREDAQANTVSLHLMGIATFVSLPKLATALERITPGTEVQVHVESLRHIDHACLDLLESWMKMHGRNGGRVIIDWEKVRGRSYQTRKAREDLAALACKDAHPRAPATSPHTV